MPSAGELRGFEALADSPASIDAGSAHRAAADGRRLVSPHARPRLAGNQQRPAGRTMAMLTTAERRTAISPDLPSGPRLRLQPDPSAGTLLDGGWWPGRPTRSPNCPG
jgi:hypothetical protein